jgi:hypothetical protein
MASTFLVGGRLPHRRAQGNRGATKGEWLVLRVMLLTGAAAAAAVLGAGAASASGWSVMSAPPIGQNATISSVSGVSDSDAWAVGAVNSGNPEPQPLADHWNGTSWQQTTVPVPTDITKVRLSAVSAASATDVWTVGRTYSQAQYQYPVAYHWNGMAWTRITANSNGSVFLGESGVADIGPSDAWAVGRGLERWDGTGWTLQAFPDPENPGTLITNIGVDFGHLDAISADAADDVWIVGHYNDPTVCNSQCGGPQQTFSLHWNGTSWNEAAMPQNTSPDVQYQFDSVDAIGPSDAWAAGYADDLSSGQTSPLIEHWDGASWRLEPIPPGAPGKLTGITGSSSSSVWAVGGSTILFWDGTSWTIMPGADPASSSQLTGVFTKPGMAITWAVGYNAVSGSDNPFVLKNGE